jgi:hypothetical protein
MSIQKDINWEQKIFFDRMKIHRPSKWTRDLTEYKNYCEYRIARYPESSHADFDLDDYHRYPAFKSVITKIVRQKSGWKIVYFAGGERLVRHGILGSPIYYYPNNKDNDDPSKGVLVTQLMGNDVVVVR